MIFLQRLSDGEQEQTLQNLRDVSREWSSQFDGERPEPRNLLSRNWTHDYWPSSDVILEIARDGRSTDGYYAKSYRSLIFVDSGWEAATVIAAHWESSSEGGEHLSTARVPMDTANLLLPACDTRRDFTLADHLGEG